MSRLGSAKNSPDLKSSLLLTRGFSSKHRMDQSKDGQSKTVRSSLDSTNIMSNKVSNRSSIVNCNKSVIQSYKKTKKKYEAT